MGTGARISYTIGLEDSFINSTQINWSQGTVSSIPCKINWRTLKTVAMPLRQIKWEQVHEFHTESGLEDSQDSCIAIEAYHMGTGA
eukprot:1158267-Pelagomonas_calceolata.AAC.2